MVARRCALQPHRYVAVRRTRSMRGSTSSVESSGSGQQRQRMEAGGASPGTSPGPQNGGNGSSGCDSPPGRWCFSGGQLAAFAALALADWLILLRKSASVMGSVALLASPGFAWTLPLALLLVVAWGGPRGSGGGCSSRAAKRN